jgi:hypothetical protein
MAAQAPSKNIGRQGTAARAQASLSWQGLTRNQEFSSILAAIKQRLVLLE